MSERSTAAFGARSSTTASNSSSNSDSGDAGSRQVLRGTITHRLDHSAFRRISNASTSTPARTPTFVSTTVPNKECIARKRKHAESAVGPVELGADSIDAQSLQPTSVPEASSRRDRTDRASAAQTILGCAGFIFTPDTSNPSTPQQKHQRQQQQQQQRYYAAQSYVACITHAQSWHVRSAIELHRKICILDWEEFYWRCDLKTISPSVHDDDYDNAMEPESTHISVPVLMIKHLRVDEGTSSVAIPATIPDTWAGNGLVWTLSQFRRKEYLDEYMHKHETAQTANDTPGSPHTVSDREDCSDHDKHCIRGVVDAVSPIFINAEGLPCAIVQLSDEDDANGRSNAHNGRHGVDSSPIVTATCIVVLQGSDAMVNHASILPQQKITITARKTSRKVPRAAGTAAPTIAGIDARINPRSVQTGMPSSIFLVTLASDMRWDASPSTPTDVSKHRTLPIRGTVTRRQLSCQPAPFSITSTRIRWFEIFDESRRQKIVVYLTEFPTSFALQLSLLPGAVVEVWNATSMHPKTPQTKLPIFAATLRTTVSLVQHSRANASRFLQHEGKKCTPSNFLPYHLSHTQQPHLGGILHEQMSRWRDTDGGDAHSTDDTNTGIMRTSPNRILQSRQRPPLTQKEEGPPQCNYKRHGLRCPKRSLGNINININVNDNMKPQPHRLESSAEALAQFWCPSAGCPANCGSPSRTAHHNHNSPGFPVPIDLASIQSTAIALIKESLRSHIFKLESADSTSVSSIRVGWTGSKHIDPSDVVDLGEPDVHRFTKATPLVFAAIRNASATNCAQGSSFVAESAGCRMILHTQPRRGATTSIAQDNVSFVIVEKIIASVLCFGVPGPPSHPQPLQGADRHQKLPFDDSVPGGDCFVLIVEHYIFVLSLQLLEGSSATSEMVKESDTIASCGRAATTTAATTASIAPAEAEAATRAGATTNMYRHDVSCTISECLHTSITLISTEGRVPKSIFGLLVRSHHIAFAPKHPAGQVNMTCVATLSHIDGDHDTRPLDAIYTLQKMNVRIETTVDEKIRARLRNTARAVAANSPRLQEGMRGDHIEVACMWWTLASCPRTSAMVLGGWDEVASATKSRPLIATMLRIPYSSLSSDTKGLPLVRCSHVELKASVTRFQPSASVDSVANTGTGTQPSRDELQYVGGRKWREGLVDRVPPRLLGTLLPSPALSNGIPFQTLRQVLLDCFHNGNNNIGIGSGSTSPSLVRGIRNARYLGVEYCEAVCFCYACGMRLCTVPTLDASQASGVTQAKESPSFWHQPLPTHRRYENMPVSTLTPTLAPTRTSSANESDPFGWYDRASVIAACNLRCSYGGHEGSYGVKWDCNGVLDDGTGQTKLFAKEEAAIALLGLDDSVVNQIELAAFLSPGGKIAVTKNRPPTEGLRAALHNIPPSLPSQIRSNNRGGNSRNRNGASGTVPDHLAHLSHVHRGEYLMQYQCRISMVPRRRLNYWVRCRHLTNSKNRLGKIPVGTYHATSNGLIQEGKTKSFVLPRIQLQLVDCSMPSQSL